MSNTSYIEYFGYLSSLIVMISFIMTSTVKLRVICSIGSALCAIYSWIVHAYPMAICNAFIVCTNIYQLLRVLRNHNDNYTIVPCDANDKIVLYFLEKYSNDIHNFHPDFDATKLDYNYARIIFSHNEVVSLQLGNITHNDLCISLDYSTPEYRDCSVGRFVYSNMSSQGIKVAYFKDSNKNTRDYIRKMGFTEKNGRYELSFE